MSEFLIMSGGISREKEISSSKQRKNAIITLDHFPGGWGRKGLPKHDEGWNYIMSFSGGSHGWERRTPLANEHNTIVQREGSLATNAVTSLPSPT